MPNLVPREKERGLGTGLHHAFPLATHAKMEPNGLQQTAVFAKFFFLTDDLS